MKAMRIKTTRDVGDVHRVGMRCGVSTLGINAIVIVKRGAMMSCLHECSERPFCNRGPRHYKMVCGAMMSSAKSRVSDVRMIVRKVMRVGVSIHVLSVRWIYAVVIVRYERRSNRTKSRENEVGMIVSRVGKVVVLVQPFLGGRGAKFPMPWYLFTARGNYLQAVLHW